MKTLLVTGLALACAAALSGCSTTSQQAFYADIQTCTRDYDGSVAAGVVGGGNFTGHVKLHCDPVVKTEPSATAAAAASNAQ